MLLLLRVGGSVSSKWNCFYFILVLLVFHIAIVTLHWCFTLVLLFQLNTFWPIPYCCFTLVVLFHISATLVFVVKMVPPPTLAMCR
jgi:hypothetical protein